MWPIQDHNFLVKVSMEVYLEFSRVFLSFNGQRLGDPLLCTEMKTYRVSAGRNYLLN